MCVRVCVCGQVAAALAPDAAAGFAVGKEAEITDIWSGKSLGKVTSLTREVPPHGNIFVTLE